MIYFFYSHHIVLAVSIDIIIERRLADIGRAVGPTDNPTNIVLRSSTHIYFERGSMADTRYTTCPDKGV